MLEEKLEMGFVNMILRGETPRLIAYEVHIRVNKISSRSPPLHFAVPDTS